MFQKYYHYLKSTPQAVLEKESRAALEELGFPYVDRTAWTETALHVLQDGYSQPFYDEDRFINQLTGEEQVNVFLLLLPALKKYYQAAGIPAQIYRDTLSDLTLRLHAYHQEEGVWGLKKGAAHWLLRIFYMNIFKLGSLQFEKVNFNFERDFKAYHWSDPLRMKALDGEPLLSLHMMKGVDLSPSAVRASLKQAQTFFKSEAQAAWICNSWMLYPTLIPLLQERSNIYQFARLFTVIGSMADPKYGEKSLFPAGRELTSFSSLQRSVLQHSDSLGMGFGVLKGLSFPVDKASDL